eukprot:2063075-Alexandrium_andersonii.AAC.1
MGGGLHEACPRRRRGATEAGSAGPRQEGPEDHVRRGRANKSGLCGVLALSMGKHHYGSEQRIG